jgi:hypothetical protein
MWMVVALRWWAITRDAFQLWLDRDAFGHAAALAVYTLFSLAAADRRRHHRLRADAVLAERHLGRGGAADPQLHRRVAQEPLLSLTVVLAVVLILLWLYYVAILLFGAAFTKTQHLARGRSVVPHNSAVLVRRELVTDA